LSFATPGAVETASVALDSQDLPICVTVGRREEQLMMLDWNAYPAELSARVKEMSKLAPNAVAGFIALDKGASKTTHLDAKTRELIAIAIAVTTRCDGCIGVHTDRAIKAGATREEVAETLGVAIALNAGAAVAYSARVLDAYAAIEGAAKAAE
jgi:AhpD family alkylhydroperoxidase